MVPAKLGDERTHGTIAEKAVEVRTIFTKEEYILSPSSVNDRSKVLTIECNIMIR